jgi:hypothetical protein
MLFIENVNDLNDTRKMTVMLIVIGILAVAAMGMLLAVPTVLKSNTANLTGHNNNANGGSSSGMLIPGG